MPSGDISLFPATTRQNQQVWSGIPNSEDVVLFMNSDLNATVYLGYVNNLVPNINAIPVAPNASLQLPATRSVYAIWTTTAGVSPLVVIPGGNAYFLGLTQALGALAIPSIRSPNFVTGVSGWTIKQDGSAEFNNLTIRGTFLGLNFILNSSGLFFYTGTPAAGNLILSITQASVTDPFGNLAPNAGLTTYQFVAGGPRALNYSGNGIQIYASTVQSGPWSTPAGGGGLLSFLPLPTGTGYGNEMVGGTLLAQDPVALGGVFETWHTIGAVSQPAFLNGWTGTLNFQLDPTGKVILSGILTTPTPAPAGTSIVYNVPAAYQPLTGKNGGVLDTQIGQDHNAAYDTTFRIANVPAFVAARPIVVNLSFPLNL